MSKAAFFTWFLWRFCPVFLNPEGLFPGSAEKMSIFGPIRTLFRTLFRKVLKSCQFWGRSVHFFSIFPAVRGPSVIRAWSVRDPVPSLRAELKALIRHIFDESLVVLDK